MSEDNTTDINKMNSLSADDPLDETSSISSSQESSTDWIQSSDDNPVGINSKSIRQYPKWLKTVMLIFMIVLSVFLSFLIFVHITSIDGANWESMPSKCGNVQPCSYLGPNMHDYSYSSTWPVFDFSDIDTEKHVFLTLRQLVLDWIQTYTGVILNPKEFASSENTLTDYLFFHVRLTEPFVGVAYDMGIYLGRNTNNSQLYIYSICQGRSKDIVTGYNSYSIHSLVEYLDSNFKKTSDV